LTHEDREAIVADGLMTVPEAAVFLRLSRSTLYNLMDSGRLPYVRLVGSGSRAARRIPRKAVVALAAAHLVGGNVNTNRAER
jgi:excisionase family DNA binding protein